MRAKEQNAIVLRGAGNKVLPRKKIREALEETGGRLTAAYEKLGCKDVRFFMVCKTDPEIRELCEAFRFRNAALAEEKLFDLVENGDQQHQYLAARFLAERLDRAHYGQTAAAQEIIVQKDGEVNIKQIFGVE